jgi:hypothetical protein
VNTERILADAEVAAVFLRALIDKGIPMNAAVSLTSSYLSSYKFAQSINDEPKKPWEDPDS